MAELCLACVAAGVALDAGVAVGVVLEANAEPAVSSAAMVRVGSSFMGVS